MGRKLKEKEVERKEESACVCVQVREKKGCSEERKTCKLFFSERGVCTGVHMLTVMHQAVVHAH